MPARDHIDKVGLLGAMLAALCCLGVSAVGVLVTSSLLNAVMLHRQYSHH